MQILKGIERTELHLKMNVKIQLQGYCKNHCQGFLFIITVNSICHSGLKDTV